MGVIAMVFVINLWKHEQQDSKIIMLINDLHKLGYNVIYDKLYVQYYGQNNLSLIMYDIINQAEKVIITLPESYKDKIGSLMDGLGNEYRNIKSGIYENKNKYILLVFSNDCFEIVPTNFKGKEIINISLDEPITYRYTKLLKCFNNPPAIIPMSKPIPYKFTPIYDRL